MDGHFISVGHLKEKIFELEHLGGTDFDLIVTNAQTNEDQDCDWDGDILWVDWDYGGDWMTFDEYLDEGMLIPKNTSVLIRRVPGRPRKPIVTAPVSEQEELNVDHNSEDVQAVKASFAVADQSYVKYGEDLEWDEFGNDLYAMRETTPAPSSIPVQDATPVSKEDEESKIKALIDTAALDWQRQPSDGFNGRGFPRGGRMPGGRGGFGRGGFEKKTPPQGYICPRCKVPGHFIQHCPTNGDPNFDIRRVKPATGIPKSMMVATPDGSYAMASCLAATLKPNEDAFEKEIEGMPSTRPIGDLPRELRCPLCQEVMKDAVLASKCCLKSFCDKCIRDHIMSRSMCECGATSILADDLLPNKTLRDTINRILESHNNSAENGGSAFQAQDMESRNPQAKVPSPTQSAASKGQQVPAPPPQQQEVPTIVETVEENKPAIVPLKSEKGIALKVPDFSEATHDSRTVKEAASQGSAPLADEEVLQKPMSGEAAAEMQWRAGPDLAPENYMMNMGPSAFNPGWNGMQPGFDGFMPYGAGPMPYGGYGVNHMDVQFGGFLPYDPFAGHGGILSYGPQRDLSELVGYTATPPVMSREEFEARKADLKRKLEMERREESEKTSVEGDGCERKLGDLGCLIEEQLGKVSLDGAENLSVPGVASVNCENSGGEVGVDDGSESVKIGVKNDGEVVRVGENGNKGNESGSGEDESSSGSSSSSSSSSSEDEDDGEKKGKNEEGIVDEETEVEDGEIMLSDVEEMVAWSDVEDDDGGGGGGPIKSKNELKDLPPVPSVNVTLEPHHETLPVGAILSMIGPQVIVEGVEKHNPLNEGSILWITESRSPLGIIDEIFGPVKNPYYIVRYNSENEVPTGIEQGTLISFVAEFADHVLNNKNLYQKGYDASNENDEELSEDGEFSDDEKEAEYKRMLKMKKRGTNDSKPGNKRKEKRQQKNQNNNRNSTAQTHPGGEDQRFAPGVGTPLNQDNHHLGLSGSRQGFVGDQGAIPPFQHRPQAPAFPAPNGRWNIGFPQHQQQNANLLAGLPPNGMLWMQQNLPYLYPSPLQTGAPFQQQIGMPPTFNPMVGLPNMGGMIPSWPMGQTSLNQPQFGMLGQQGPPPPLNGSGEQAAQSQGSQDSRGVQPPPPAFSFNDGRSGGRGGGRGRHGGRGRYGGGRGKHS